MSLSLLFSLQHEAHWIKKNINDLSGYRAKCRRSSFQNHKSVVVDNSIGLPWEPNAMALTLWQEIVANYKPSIQIDRLQRPHQNTVQCCSVFWCVWGFDNWYQRFPYIITRRTTWLQTKATANKKYHMTNNMVYPRTKTYQFSSGPWCTQTLKVYSTLGSAQCTGHRGKTITLFILRLQSSCK